jgi:hypothetical protein
MHARQARLAALRIATRTLQTARDDLHIDYGDNTEKVKQHLERLIVELTARKGRLQQSLDKACEHHK